MQKIALLFISILFISFAAEAQKKSYTWSTRKSKSSMFNSVMESNLIQFATAEQANKTLSTIPRYTYFFNTGFEANFKVDNGVKIFTGLGIKNIGLIIKANDSTRIKHRVYTVGAPFGLKFHSHNNRIVFKTGIDMSLAFNYKTKKCVNDKKTKYSEWFSDRTSLLFPSLFAGLSIHGLSVNANYYLNNFFNPLMPEVSEMDARLFTLGIGLNIDGKKSSKKKKNS